MNGLPDQDDDYGEPVGSSDRCGQSVYAGDDDGSGVCDQCQWWIEQFHLEIENDPEMPRRPDEWSDLHA